MTRKHITAILMILFINSDLAAGNWELVKNEDDIRVYLRSVDNSSVREFMAETVTSSSLSAILALFDDIGSYTKWNYRCREAELLQKKNDRERVIYMVMASPWPVSDRDMEVKCVLSQDKKTGNVTIALTGIPGFTAARQGRVRMTSLVGYWRLEPLGKGKVRVVYSMHSEPGGNIPYNLINRSLVDISFNTLLNLKKMIRLSPYKEAGYNFIKEKE